MKINRLQSKNFVTFGRLLFIPMLVALLATISVAEAQANANTENKTKIVVLGDSLVAGFGLAPGEDFPNQLQKLLDTAKINADVINAGVSGDTSSGGLSRLDWSVPDDTNGVILELGANDALRAVPSSLTATNLEAIITRLKARNIDVLLVGMMAPPNMGEEYGKEFNAIFPTLSEKYALEFYPFFLQDVAAVPELNQADGIHPTAKGITMIAERFLPTAVRFIERLNQR